MDENFLIVSSIYVLDRQKKKQIKNKKSTLMRIFFVSVFEKANKK